HRDFKPANVMLDGTGRVRITDFGLAGVSGEALRAGTPAYMAPEQLAGQEVTARSDLYALGLVLYELFTGRRALEGRSIAELIHRREQEGIAPPSTIVRDLSAEIDVAVMRCLVPDPSSRPASALAVAAALPGGDPLAAALAAGETPSPEMVAAAGLDTGIPAGRAAAGAGFVVLALLGLVLMYQRVMIVNRVPAPKSAAALQDRAEEALERLGYGDSVVGRASGLGLSLDFARYIERTSDAPDRWNALGVARPETFLFWHRISPRPLVPWGTENPLQATNPPGTLAGMALVVLDGSGRLAELFAVPEPLEADNVRREMDWNVLFTLAGLDVATFRAADPQWVPPVYADERRAWEGPLPDRPELTLRVEAAAMGGRPVFFTLTGPWSRSARAARPLPQSAFAAFLQTAATLVLPALMLAAAVLAWRNVRDGRGDHKGAIRAATVLFCIGLVAWLPATQHTGVLSADLARFFSAAARALFDSALLWLAYLGLEPYIRRFSPDSLIGWTRLLSGRWRDPQVASDVLLGICAGLAMTLFYAVHNLVPPLLGQPEPMPLITNDLTPMLGLRYAVGSVLAALARGLGSAMLAVTGVIGLLILLKRKWAAHIASSVIFVWVVISGMFNPGTPLLDVAIGFGIILVWTGVILYRGLLATVAALATHFLLLRAPLTTDFSSWRATPAITYLLVVAGVGLVAAWIAWKANPALNAPAPGTRAGAWQA
ncbi:MAG TPA: protein kinase, partial [Vicinamibacterales bacterium]|nr:protein kinase [Vicinamibacterales bacterium]